MQAVTYAHVLRAMLQHSMNWRAMLRADDEPNPKSYGLCPLAILILAPNPPSSEQEEDTLCVIGGLGCRLDQGQWLGPVFFVQWQGLVHWSTRHHFTSSPQNHQFAAA